MKLKKPIISNEMLKQIIPLNMKEVWFDAWKMTKSGWRIQIRICFQMSRIGLLLILVGIGQEGRRSWNFRVFFARAWYLKDNFRVSEMLKGRVVRIFINFFAFRFVLFYILSPRARITTSIKLFVRFAAINIQIDSAPSFWIDCNSKYCKYELRATKK